MTNVLKNVNLGTAFIKDPVVALKDFIFNNYTILSPAKTDVRFDTVFGQIAGKKNHIIVKGLNTLVETSVAGNSRKRYQLICKVHMLCYGNDAQSNLFAIKEHLDDIINANPLGMESDGIHEISIYEIQQINIVTEEVLNTQQNTKEFSFRDTLNVKLIYNKINVVV